jgi:hypothetical protein
MRLHEERNYEEAAYTELGFVRRTLELASTIQRVLPFYCSDESVGQGA